MNAARAASRESAYQGERRALSRLRRSRATASVSTALAAVLLLLSQHDAEADRAAGDVPASKPRAQVQHKDHARVFIEYLEIAVPGSGPIPEAAGAGIEVAQEGAEPWQRKFDSYLNIFRMGPILAPVGAELTITVWREAAGRRRAIAKIPFRAPDKPMTKTYSQGSLKKMTVSATPVDAWVIPDIPVVVAFSLKPRAKKYLEAALLDFHERLVDATDGQVRIEKLTVYEPPLPPSIDADMPGAIYVRTPSAGKRSICAHSMGRPARPGRIPVEMSKQGGGKPARLGAVLMHEFGHAYFGLEDEYLPGGAVGCPDREADAADTEASFMNAPASAGREACRPANHDLNGDTTQTKTNQASCWTTMTSVLRADVGLSLLRGSALPGPKPLNTPAVVFASGSDVVDFTDSDRTLSDEAINEVVQRHGGAVGKCLVRAGERTVVIEFTIRGVDGRVTRTAANGSTSGVLATCTRKVMQGMKFPTFDAAFTTARVQITR